jgi:UDP-2-acetamido-3-amino-2,3-dideoxy-glucuronate N-acetyltransferase
MTPPAYIHPSAIVDEGAEIGPGVKIWHFTHVLKGTRIGESSTLGQNVMVGPNVRVGARVKVQNNVSIYEGVTLEDEVFCGPSCVFTNVLTPRAFVERKAEFAPTLVKRGATIGANATIVCGVTIGRYAMVGAGAVVTRDVRDHALVLGNPARQRGWVSRTGEVLKGNLICPRTGERYREGRSGLVLLEGTP